MSDDLYEAEMNNMAAETMTLQAKCDLLKSQLDETAANQGRIQSINAMFIGQISRLMYAFNPEGERLDPVDPNKNLEAVVSEVIDQAIKVFTDPQLGHGQIIALTREAKVLTSVIKDHQEYQSNIRKAIVASGLLEGVRDLDSMHLDETVEELIRITRRWISGRDEWMGEAVRNADSAAEAERRLRDARNTIVEGLRLLRFPPSGDPMKCGNYEEISLEAATKMMIDTIDGLKGGISSSNARESNLMGTIREMEGSLNFIRGFVAGREGATSSTSRLVQEDLRAIVNDVKAAVESRAAFEVDANNLRKLNKHLTKRLLGIGDILRDAGIHRKRATEEHLSGNANLILFDLVDAVDELKGLRAKVESLRNLKIEPVPMVSEAWNALRHAGVNTVDHATLADAIGWLGQRYGDVCREANRLIMESETRNEFVNGVLTVHTEGTTVIIVDRNT